MNKNCHVFMKIDERERPPHLLQRVLSARAWAGLFAFCLILIVSGGCASHAATVPLAVKGVLDLRQYDFEKSGPVALSGEWVFFWDSLQDGTGIISLDELEKKANLPVGIQNVPGDWMLASDRNRLPDHGQATYALRVLLPDGNGTLALKTGGIRMASRVYANGRFLFGNGVPEAGLYSMRNVPGFSAVPWNSGELLVVIQVADRDYKRGGIQQDVLLGLEQQMLLRHMQAILMDFLPGLLLLILGITLALFQKYEQRIIGLPLLGMFCLIIAFYSLNQNSKVLPLVIPDIPYEIFLRLKIALLDAGVVIGMIFVRITFPKKVPIPLVWMVGIIYAGATFLAAFGPLSLYSVVETILVMASLPIVIILIWAFARLLVIRHYPDKKILGWIRYGSGFLTLLLYVFLSNLVLNQSEQYSALSAACLVFFLISLALMLVQEYRQSVLRVEMTRLQLVRMGKLKDEVLVHTTHELKTPLHSIIQMTQALLDGRMGPISEEQDRNLRFTISTAKRMSSMIFDIIDFENVKNGMLVLDLTHFDISNPLRMVVEVMQYLYREKGILLINHVPDYTHWVLVDIYRLRQVFYNLIGNALKYTEAGEVILTSSSKDGNVFIHVSDTGIGIEKDDFERIFEPHSRGVRQTGPQSGSAGLGLSIARQLIRQMGGDVWVSRSAPGQGTEFIISLPLTGIETVVAQAGNDNHTGLHPATTSSGTPGTGERESGSRSRRDLQDKPEVPANGNAEGMTILVVDGDVVFSRGIADLLIGKGYRVCVAHSGEQALRELKRDIHVGMVLLEVMMPGMSGYEACRRIRESRTLFELPVVLMLSAILPEDLETGMDAGANDFLVKPFEEQALLARVKTLYQLKEVANRALQAETAFLHAQIKPHFLYNALSVIMALCYSDGPEAGRLLGEFSNYIRLSFDVDPYIGVVSLKRELSLVRSYVVIQKARFGKRLEYVLDVPPDCLEVRVPALSLQPLVENAIRHGLMRRMEGGCVSLTAERDGQWLAVRVSDNGTGMDETTLASLLLQSNTGGVGLRNIHRRLMNLYGLGLNIESRLGEGTTVIMRIPAMWASGGPEEEAEDER